MKTLTVSSEGFGVKWGKTVIDYLIKLAVPHVEIKYEMSLDCDVIVLSHFINDEALWNKQPKKYIYWSGESYKVFNHSKASLGLHMLTTKEENNKENKEENNKENNEENNKRLYIPYTLYSPYLYKERKYSNDIDKRPYLVAYCSSNTTKNREDLFNAIVNKIGEDSDKCHALGKCFGKFKSTQKKIDGHWEDETLIDNYKNYKFVFALENKQVDGYVTEKMLNAFYSGAIPIYWGSSNVDDLFNKKAFINLANFDSVEQCAEHIINMSDEELKTIQNEPIYNKTSEIIHLMDDKFYSKYGNKVRDNYVNIVRDFLQE